MLVYTLYSIVSNNCYYFGSCVFENSTLCLLQASMGSWRYSRNVVRGKVWRPDYAASEESSERGSLRSSKFLLRQESSYSVSSDFHFNTLHTIDHPNALVLEGFGETSTDETLKRQATLKNNGSLPHISDTVKSNGTLPYISDTMKSKAEQAEITYNNEIKCREGWENGALMKSESFDSIDRAIDDWKTTIKPTVTEDDLLSSQNEGLFAYDNLALQTSEPELNKTSPVDPPNVAIVHPNQRLSVLNMKNFFENSVSSSESNDVEKKMPPGAVRLPNRIKNKFENNAKGASEKPSAHVPPQVCVVTARDADVQL